MKAVTSVFLCSLIPAFALSGLVRAETVESGRVIPELRATRVNPHAPIVDGDLSDSVWGGDHIQFASAFTQRTPDEGQPCTESTLVAVAYDEDALYVAFWCYDREPDKVDRQLVRRDRSANSDFVVARFDTYHDHQTGNAFEVSAAGVQRDYRIYNDDNADYGWDGVWEAAVRSQPWGWSAEMRIPYHCLRFAAAEEHTWGADFARYINRREESVRWAFTPQAEGGFASNFGHLTGLQGIKSARHTELLPYVVSSAERQPKSIGNPDGRDYMGNTGFDLKYALTSNLILDATVNPDFGQVELDQPVLNLSAYETYFSEKRPFFLEGANLFESEYTLFYSRRVGRAPWRGVSDPDGVAYYTHYPEATTILGAAKLTGKLAGKTSVAVVTAVTDEESARYASQINVVLDTVGWSGDEPITEVTHADTVFRESVVEPRASYSAFRLQQDILSNSNVGAILTLASQATEDPAVTGAVDWRLYTNNGQWRFQGQGVFSRVDPEEVGYAFDGVFSKVGGKHTQGSIGWVIKTPEFNINDLGFSTRADTRNIWGWFQYRTQDDWWIVRNSWNNLNFYSTWNFDGVNRGLGGNWNSYFELKNFWAIGAGAEIQAEKYSDDETRGIGLWVWPVYPTTSWWIDVNTDLRKPVSLSFGPTIGWDRGGTWWSSDFGLDIRPRSNMEFSMGVNYSRFLNGTRWVDNLTLSDSVEVGGVMTAISADSSLFATLDRDELSLSASASIVFNRNLTCQLSAEGLIAGLDYFSYRYYRGGQEYSDSRSGYDYDYNYSSINSTLLIRWEYSPGSTLYVVWTRSRPEVDVSANDLDFSRDIDRLFSGQGHNVFLVKASYWLNM